MNSIDKLCEWANILVTKLHFTLSCNLLVFNKCDVLLDLLIFSMVHFKWTLRHCRFISKRNTHCISSYRNYGSLNLTLKFRLGGPAARKYHFSYKTNWDNYEIYVDVERLAKCRLTKLLYEDKSHGRSDGTVLSARSENSGKDMKSGVSLAIYRQILTFLWFIMWYRWTYFWQEKSFSCQDNFVDKFWQTKMFDVWIRDATISANLWHKLLKHFTLNI